MAAIVDKTEKFDHELKDRIPGNGKVRLRIKSWGAEHRYGMLFLEYVDRPSANCLLRIVLTRAITAIDKRRSRFEQFEIGARTMAFMTPADVQRRAREVFDLFMDAGWELEA